jgi:hypothetical protein
MRALAAALLLAGTPTLAFAQDAPPATARPVMRERSARGLVIDARGSFAGYGLRTQTATAFGVATIDLPSRGFGFTAGAHLLIPLGRVSFGAGGEMMLTQRSRERLDALNEPTGVVLKTRAFSLSPQVSLNFGRARGWSYVSGGIGVMSFETWDAANDRPERRLRGINYGGGLLGGPALLPHAGRRGDQHRSRARRAAPGRDQRGNQSEIAFSDSFSSLIVPWPDRMSSDISLPAACRAASTTASRMNGLMPRFFVFDAAYETS